MKEIRKCTLCKDYLPHGINPVLSVDGKSKVAIIGQAPGSVVHNSGIPWDDKSGDRLRDWLGINKTVFYNPKNFALIPMGFCYPGKGKSGDLPPRKECAPQWHSKVFNKIENLELIILIGTYAQAYYLPNKASNTLTETVQNYPQYLPQYFVLPHPSPRNNIWLKKNPWFINELIPFLQTTIKKIGL